MSREIQDEKFRNLNCANIECDEIWGFIGSNRKNAARTGNFGDVWTFIGLDSDSKLIPSFICGKRDMYHARAFMDDLASRMARPASKSLQIRCRHILKRLNAASARKWTTAKL